jgi:hypothetical protein
MLNQKIVKICEQKFTYLNYSNKTKGIYIDYIEITEESIGMISLQPIKNDSANQR